MVDGRFAENISWDYKENSILLADNISFLQGSVEKLFDSWLLLDNGGKIYFDFCVIATGMTLSVH